LLEEGTAGKNASVEEDRDPHVKLPKPRVSHLATLEEAKFPTLLSPSPTIFEAARMQRLLVVNAGMPETPEPDRGTDLEPPPHDTPPPVEVAEPPNHLPGQIRAPTDIGKPLNSLQGETSLRTMVDEPDVGACTRGHDAHRRGAWPSS